MSRFRRAAHSAASSYFALGAGTCYALASVPLALHYLSKGPLPKERFALWALMSGISGYLALIDLGMSGSVGRLLVDHKDRASQGTYGSLILTGWLVLVVQGLILFLVCFGLAPWMAVLLNIPPELEPEFVGLMRWQGVTMAVSFATRIFGHLLYAHQRVDLNNYSQVAGSAAGLVSLWFFFYDGYGVFSLVWSTLVNFSVLAVGMWLAALKLRLFPPPGCWGRPSWRYFTELFMFGKDLFLLALGGQLILQSQTMIITRRLGLEAAAVWAVGTKAYNLVIQLIWRTTDAASPGFAEMLFRREEKQVLHRYGTITMLTASLSGFCAVTYAMCNSSFVSFWTSGDFTWPVLNDVLLGACMLVSALVHCHAGFIGVTKEIRSMRYVFFIEGTVFVVSALLVARQGQLYPVVLASLVCSLLFSGAYSSWRVARFFHLPVREVAFRWLLPMWRFLWRAVPPAVAIWWATHSLSALPRFIIHGAICGTMGLILFAKYGIPASFQHELARRLPGFLAPALRWLFAPAPDVREVAPVARDRG